MQILRVESLNEKGPLIRFAHTGLKACATRVVGSDCQSTSATPRRRRT